MADPEGRSDGKSDQYASVISEVRSLLLPGPVSYTSLNWTLLPTNIDEQLLGKHVRFRL